MPAPGSQTLGWNLLQSWLELKTATLGGELADVAKIRPASRIIARSLAALE
ncbi:MAG: hypothetical protein OXI38_01075 [Bacteroidota bacterium]|nr:hypothetical protein [Bacteroidota bacterium]